MNDRPRGPLRLLAPVALIAFGLVFLIMVAGSLGGSSSSGSDSPVDSRSSQKEKTAETSETASDTATESPGSLGGPIKDSYTVKAGDTLDAIAAKTGATVDEIRDLNPAVDPQALIAGTELQLRE